MSADDALAIAATCTDVTSTAIALLDAYKRGLNYALNIRTGE